MSIIRNQRWILKQLFGLAASLKSVMVAKNSVPNFDLEDFFKFVYRRMYIKCQLVPKKRCFYTVFKATKVPKT